MAVLSLIAAAACTKNEFDSQNIQDNDGRTVLTVELPGETKTVLGDAEDGVRPVLWSNGDKISVNGNESEALKIDDNATAADFTVNAELTAPYSIIYPASMVKEFKKGESYAVITLPSQQKAVTDDDNIVSGSLPMAGYSTTLSAKMGQLCGILGIRLKAGSGTGLIRYIEVTATGGEPVSGDFSVDFQNCTLSSEAPGVNVIRMEVQKALSEESVSTFNVILPAGVYSKGFSVKVVDENGQAMVRNIGGNRELEAGKLMQMPELTFVPNGEEKGVEIATPEAWNSFATAYNAGKYPDSQIATITADLDFSSVAADDFVTLGLRDGAKQLPEGADPKKYFAGTLNGNGKKILNLNTDVPFIQSIGTGALVQDINIDKTCSFTPWYGGEKQLEFGSLIGYCSEGTVKNCTSEATVTVSQCNATANKAPLYIGGLIGRNRSATISGCTSSATIVSDATYITDAASKTSLYIGGFTGYCSNPNGVLENCTNIGSISVASTALNILVGGICARASAGTISKCTNSGTITESTAKVQGEDPCKFIYLGGLFSVVDASGDEQYLKVTGCSNSGDITSSSDVKQQFIGGLAGQLSTVKAEFSDNTTSGNITTTAALRNLYCGGLFGRITEPQTLTLNGEPSTGAINIGATESFKATYLYCGGLIGQTTAEVTLSGNVTWKSSVTYDISSAANRAAESFFGGFVGCAYGAPINISGMKSAGNVIILTAAEKAKAVQHKLSGLGGIIGGATAGATISNCSNSGSVQMSNKTSAALGYTIHVGGIAGRLYGGTVEIKHCTNSQRIQENQHNQNPWTGYEANAAGGIVGSIGYICDNTYSALIDDCYNTGKVYAYCGSAGGIVGYISNGTITNSSSTGAITRSAPGGGIAGVTENSAISSCHMKANIDIDGRGTATTATADAGGIIGEAIASSVNGCQYFGKIAQTKADNASFGGIIGKADAASSAGTTADCGFGGIINGTNITEETNLSTYAIGSTTGTRGTFYLWNGTL